ncbi:hypothetical protein X777_15333 [Ooceraea biroi]|uniref:Uncharacterized protein n=1 Tax=Ooceraea biroi TaxID=2015173 RepID=A0A026WWD9_OOCBI|nr:hypothetical protein X777_15333 [Ooceraea biroi]
MAASALEEKINKIRQQNEEIRRRHEEVEEDKKNAAKLNALVQMVPSTDWPERKEPPEFSNPPRASNKPKPTKEHHEHPHQYHSVGGEGRKVHTFAQGQGPPPDPKYNFLADAERETGNVECTKEAPSNRGQKHSRGTFRRKPGGKDGMQRDYRANRGPHREEHQPEYEAWRAERNRIDEDRISRQRTAEGNWRREWDNDKAHIVDEVTRSDARLGDYVKKDHKDFDRRYHVNGNDYVNYNRGSHRSYRGNSRHFHNNYENRSNNAYHQDGYAKNPASSEERTVVATDKSIKVTLNQGNMAKGPVMSVKVNSPSIAGTGRVGPRQRSRITYSSHSDVEAASPDAESSRPKSYEDKTTGIYHDNLQRSPNSRKSQPAQRKKDFGSKSPYFRKKDIRREDANENPQKHHETESRQESEESQKSCQPEPQNLEENVAKSLPEDEISEKEDNVVSADESNMKNTETKDNDDQNDDSNSCVDDVKNNEVHVNQENDFVSQNSDLPNADMEIDTYEASERLENKSEESPITQSVVTSETTETNLIVSSARDTDDNDKNEIQSTENSSCDANNDDNDETENKERNPPVETTEAIVNNNCDSKQTENIDEQNNDIKDETKDFPEEKDADEITIPSSIDTSSAAKESNELSSDDDGLKEKDVPVAEDAIATTDEQISTGDQQDAIKSVDTTQERTSNDKEEEEEEEKDSAANGIVVDKIEFPKEDVQVEDEEAASLKIVETEK